MLSTLAEPPDLPEWSPCNTDSPCRLCGARLLRTLIDLGQVPLANRTIAAGAPDGQPYRLHARICDTCTLVQVADVAAPETIAAPRPYLDWRSAAGLSQTRRHADFMRKRLHLGGNSLVIKVGPSDGILLGHFQAAGIRVLAIDPTDSRAETVIPTEVCLFNTETAMQIAVRHGCADLVVANNVLPHAPDMFDFAAGLSSILRPNGILTLQVPHLLSLLQKMQFDAFGHDSYTYLSLRVLEHLLRSVGLRVFDAERLPDHGGSLRVYACHVVAPYAARPSLKAVRLVEGASEVEQGDFYAGFSDRVAAVRDEIRDFLQTRRTAGRRVAAYGAAPRGSMLLHCCGITTQEIAWVADPDPASHGRLLPGSRIPIVPVQTMMGDPPDDIIILPWPNAVEIAVKLLPLRQHGTQFWTPVPRIARV
ncbi:MAG: class I SAM-dependent methyltransferase [Pseudomonadota bacterium]|nr:class I SAM-dependent methyltransferase [Pseudomonadota bacterium]